MSKEADEQVLSMLRTMSTWPLRGSAKTQKGQQHGFGMGLMPAAQKPVVKGRLTTQTAMVYFEWMAFP